MMLTDAPNDRPGNKVPRRLTPLVGRAAELAQIKVQLLDPACRLLTLLGAGGMGKTRLALEVAAMLADGFVHELCFVNLQPLSDPAQLPTALADALHFPLNGSDPVDRQLLRFLTNQELLLVLDNFEHLLPSADFVATLLAHAPGVKILVTSREVLNLQEEWLFPLTGLAFPAPGFDPQQIEQYAAATLFVERMRRLRPQSTLAEEATAIGRICQLVEGMPLALELAATWTKTLSCAEIVGEIERNLTFLATNTRNTPERHRSMLAVFQQSWQQLTSQEQSVFARLAVFRGGFERRAAAFVALATPAILTLLVDKSLIRLEQGGRFVMHELLRQFAEQQLQQSKDELALAQARQGAYFTDFLHQRLSDLLGQRQLAALAEIKVELDNIRLAWAWLVARRDVEGLRKVAPALSQYYQMQSRFQEGVERFQTAEEQLATLEPSPVRDLVAVTIQALLGWLYIRTARLELATTVLAESHARFQALQLPPVTGLGTDPRLVLGILALLQGEYPRANQLGLAALATAEEHQQGANAEFALSVLAHTAFVQGELDLAQHYSERGLALAQSHDERWFSAYALNLLGQIAAAGQEEGRALGYLASSYARREEFNDREGMARARHLQGNVHIQQGQWEKAQVCYHQALTLYEQIQDLGGVVNVQTQLGHLALTINDQPAARYHLGQALQRIGEQHLVSHLFPVLLGVGELFLKQRWTERGVALIALALHHPASEQDVKRRAAQILTQQRALLPQSELAATVAQAEATDLVALTSKLRVELASSLAAAEPASPANGETDRHVEQIDKLQLQQQAAAALVEPLTRRELEILQLVAAGLTNEQIANQYIVAIGTVKSHTAQIYGKLGVNSRTQAVAVARKLGLLTD